MEACELPEGVALPLQNMEDLTQLEKRLENMETKTLLVSQSVQFYTLCPLEKCNPFIFVISLACVIIAKSVDIGRRYHKNKRVMFMEHSVKCR